MNFISWSLYVGGTAATVVAAILACCSLAGDTRCERGLLLALSLAMVIAAAAMLKLGGQS